MKRLALIVWLVGLSLPLMAEDVIYLTTDQFRQRVFDYTVHREWHYEDSIPCVIDFYTTWCGPCKMLAPIMEQLSQKYCGEVIFYKVDTERERELAFLFGIHSIPQVLYIPKEGLPQKHVGLYPREQIEEIIDHFLLKNAD